MHLGNNCLVNECLHSSSQQTHLIVGTQNIPARRQQFSLSGLVGERGDVQREQTNQEAIPIHVLCTDRVVQGIWEQI